MTVQSEIKNKKKVMMNDFIRMFHMISCLYFVRIWIWHTSPESVPKTANFFGWHFRYFTFCSYTLQIIQLTLATLVDLTPINKGKALRKITDDISCMVFVTANAVTILFYAIKYAYPRGLIEDGMAINYWIGYSLHVVNAIIACLDLILGFPRLFSFKSFIMTSVYSISYLSWMCIIRYSTGIYPYPFLNKIAEPYGILIVVVLAAILMIVLFKFGSFLSKLKRKYIGDIAKLEDMEFYIGTRFKQTPIKRSLD